MAHILGSLDVGGAEMRTLEMGSALRERGIIFDVVTLSGRTGVLADELREIGGTVWPLRLEPAFPRRFTRLLIEGEYDAVHSHVATASGLLLLLARRAGVRVRIAHFHSDGDGRANSPRRRLQRWLLRRWIDENATAMVGVSAASLDFHVGSRWRSDPRCYVLPNGLDLTRVEAPAAADIRQDLGIEDLAPILIHVGRTAYEKNRERLPRLLAQSTTRPAPHLILAGEITRDERGALVRASVNYGISDRFHILGPRRDAPSLIRQSDLMLLPSRREGLPGVLLEAAAVGTPVVASDLPGIRPVAERFDLVRLVAQGASDEEWGAVIDGVLFGRPNVASRQIAFEDFKTSQYALPNVAAQYQCLYIAGERRASH